MNKQDVPPGPYTVLRMGDDDGFAFVVDANGDVVASVNNKCATDILAASWQMREALQKVVLASGDHHDDTWLSAPLRHLVKDALAAAESPDRT